MTTTYLYGDIFNPSVNNKINIHDLNKANNIRRNLYNFDNLSSIEKILGIVDPNNSLNYLQNGLRQNEEEYIKELILGTKQTQSFTLPQGNVISLKNKEQNNFTFDIILNANELNGQYPHLTYIELELDNIEIESVTNNFDTWDVINTTTNIVFQKLNGHFIPENLEYTLCTIKYKEPNENWNRQVQFSNVIVNSYTIHHILNNTSILQVPNITGGNTYDFQSLNYLATKGYINDNIRIKPVNHSQQDNMFIIFHVSGATLNVDDVIFVVDNHLFGETEKFKLRNYLCGWHEITPLNIHNVRYLAVYIDFNSEYGNTIANVDYSYKYYQSSTGKIFDLEAIDANSYRALGYGSVQNPLVLTKSNESVINTEIDGENIYNLLQSYL